MKQITFLTASAMLEHWQGHRRLTRRVIEAFPEKELFEYLVVGMRPFSEMAKELLAIAVPGLKEIISNDAVPFDEKRTDIKTKADILKAWDESTVLINQYFNQISEQRFRESHNLFGQYEFPIYQNLLYFIDNEIHHRGQGFVYLRTLGIEPPFFWER